MEPDGQTIQSVCERRTEKASVAAGAAFFTDQRSEETEKRVRALFRGNWWRLNLDCHWQRANLLNLSASRLQNLCRWQTGSTYKGCRYSWNSTACAGKN